MSDNINGKLVIKTYVNTSAVDQHGRQSGKWVTLMTQHGLNYEEAEFAGREFTKNNERLTVQLYVQWIPYPQHVYL